MLFFKVVWKRLSDHIRNITGSIEDRAVLQYTRKCNNQKIKSFLLCKFHHFALQSILDFLGFTYLIGNHL